MRAFAAGFAKHAWLKSLLLCMSCRKTAPHFARHAMNRIGKVNKWQIQAPVRSKRMTSTRASAHTKF
ncbi:hypothetical protein AGR1A_Cc50385 [Agrobacterium fabacearum CFBP 5771]|nr:hypothetical protein AGR1A_Cc50385 [Agrobacterium fabacearum CFBP 5771]